MTFPRNNRGVRGVPCQGTTKVEPWHQGRASNVPWDQWEFQDPTDGGTNFVWHFLAIWIVRIFQHTVGLKNRPTIYGRYLQFRFLTWPVMGHPIKWQWPMETYGNIWKTDWWFGTFYFCIYWEYIGKNHPNWLSYFSEGLKPPTS